ncbi:hypothetical protein [Phenylobacterium montanum]|uniref:Secreted protein n=1 Tax=Phenylobacterium montanum TaxID=2823693 RepID=A0A975G1Z3_9CAUL|nr:hypothetical protein [Caulobacter sp. S6]QUD89241.1 hypothetical protein KCG34_05000 [Caulobacter sp. S6]
MKSVVRVTFASVLALAIGGAGRLACAQSEAAQPPEPAPSLTQDAPAAYPQNPAPNAAPVPAPAPHDAPPPAIQAVNAPGPEYLDAQARPAPAPHMPREVIEAASAYATFVAHAAAIDDHFADGGAVSAAMATSEAYQADQLAEGSVAYAALVALQDAGFVEGVRRATSTPEAADALVRTLEADPAKVASLPGADGAALRVNAVLGWQADQVGESGKKLRQASYDMQHDDWTRQMTADAPARLAQAKALSSTPVSPSADDISQLFKVAAALRDQTVSAPGGAPGYTPVVQRGMTLAVLALVGRATREELESTGLTKVRDSAGCMQAAKLNLYQCLAVAGPHYEDVYCIAEHALKDTGRCLRDGAGAPLAQPASMASTPNSGVSATDPDTYAVPVAVAATAGRQ